MSARTDTQSRERGLRIGAQEYITKPFDPTTLAARINEIVTETKSGSTHDLRPRPSRATV